jgi:hypothetical protein
MLSQKADRKLERSDIQMAVYIPPAFQNLAAGQPLSLF